MENQKRSTEKSCVLDVIKLGDKMRSDRSQILGNDFNTNSKSLFRQIIIKREEDGFCAERIF